MHEREKAVAQRICGGWKQARIIMHPLRPSPPDTEWPPGRRAAGGSACGRNTPSETRRAWPAKSGVRLRRLGNSALLLIASAASATLKSVVADWRIGPSAVCAGEGWRTADR